MSAIFTRPNKPLPAWHRRSHTAFTSALQALGCAVDLAEHKVYFQRKQLCPEHIQVSTASQDRLCHGDPPASDGLGRRDAWALCPSPNLFLDLAVAIFGPCSRASRTTRSVTPHLP